MERECIKKLIEWKNSRKRKPLVLMGARQVGKTWLMEEFAKREFGEDYVIVNFMRHQSLCQQLKLMDLDPKALVRLLQTATGRRIVPGKTLLILDEIQESPNALTSLKFFYEEMPELAVMAAGSLLGLSYGKDGKGGSAENGDRGSFPVGKVDRLNVYPMSFAEFLVANGKKSFVETIDAGDWLSVEALSNEFELLLKTYFIVGGMPEAVADWIETGSLAESRQTQLRILSDYDDDFKKHAPIELLPKIRLVWQSVPAQLAKENEKFCYGNVRQGARARDYESALEWLQDAGILYKVHRVCPPGLPIVRYMSSGAFKVFVHDVGLLCAMSAVDPAIVLEKTELFTHFKGALTEQFVLQEMKTQSIESGYWTPDEGVSEVDFVVQGKTGVYPVEVKAATNTKAKSLGVYMTAYHPSFAVKTSLRNFSMARDVRSLPLYAFSRWIGGWIFGDSASRSDAQKGVR